MPLEKIYVIRHGFRSNWLVDPATGTYSAYIPSPTGIPADPALTSHGVSQARELARHLMTLDPPVEAVYSSPFYRCLQTLEPFMQNLELRKQQRDRKASGPAAGDDGVVARPAAIAVLKSLFPAIDEGYQPVVVPSPRGETLAQLQERVAVALRGIIEQCDAQGARSALLCTHAAVVIVLGRILTGQRKGEASGGKASLSADSFDAAASLITGGWNCELNSDCSFLSGGKERGWRFAGDESFPGTGSLSRGDAESKL
ncbi:histidine phosphatase superfamily (branch 1) domain-containing protein [Hirsutella rhossiliensis]|uniref:Histidine phosphatase superfamily (Branch 1) domain-containing protein n=1 Tax=Hirsutella rhossiliensis TaxID=111463 RepID=A0A9P8MZ88_9HYPO|nr:histidine phosphatase superfamily (branch 1) domain-containing protein [Hirsutella rhossiliensis]KAH0963029.1 histidine phosphatase superfamily (branch 1) domain-containing protein [Hirsutella rhossiliensis]